MAGTVAGIKRGIMAKSLKLVIFDCDGTLVDSQHMICTAMSRAYGAHGLPVPERETMLSIDRIVADRGLHGAGQGRRTISGCKPRRAIQARLPCDAQSGETSSRYIPARGRDRCARAARRCRARHCDGKIAARCAARAQPSRPARPLHHDQDRGRRALEARSRHGDRCDARSWRRQPPTPSWSATPCTTSRWRAPRALPRSVSRGVIIARARSPRRARR